MCYTHSGPRDHVGIVVVAEKGDNNEKNLLILTSTCYIHVHII